MTLFKEATMLELIGTPGYETLSKPDKTVLDHLDHVLQKNAEPVVYEIGIGIGATTLPMATRMANKGRILLFSREPDVKALASDLFARGFTNIEDSWGSGGNTYSGYHFELALGFVRGELPPFDIAYIDGGHVFHLDAPATSILKELSKPGGLMIFDDWHWSLAKSPTLNPISRPKTAQDYDPRQIEMSHVQLVCQALMDTDSRFEFLGLSGSSAVYRRLASPRTVKRTPARRAAPRRKAA